MNSLNHEEASAIMALVNLRCQTGDSFEIQPVDTCSISSIESKENGHQTYITLATNLKTTTTRTKVTLAAENAMYPQYFTKSEFDVPMEDCGTSSTDAEFWREYLARFPGESLSPVSISTDGSNFKGDGESNGSILRMGYGEPFTDDYTEKWASIYMTEPDLWLAPSDRKISEPFLEHCVGSYNDVALPEVEMDWTKWSELIDEQQVEKGSGPENNLTGEKANAYRINS